MQKRLIVIKLTLWWGIIADLLETIRMITPSLFIKSAGADITINTNFQFALLYGAPVMFGWTIILFWASWKPIERRGIFICLIPVILFYFIVEIAGIQMGVINFNQTVPTFILQTILLFLTISSYIFSKRIAIINLEDQGVRTL